MALTCWAGYRRYEVVSRSGLVRICGGSSGRCGIECDRMGARDGFKAKAFGPGWSGEFRPVWRHTHGKLLEEYDWFESHGARSYSEAVEGSRHGTCTLLDTDESAGLIPVPDQFPIPTSSSLSAVTT